MLVAHVNQAEGERALLKAPSTWHAPTSICAVPTLTPAIEKSYDTIALYEARKLFEQSISADPKFARPHASLSQAYSMAWIIRADDDFLKPETLEHAYRLAHGAVEFDANLPMARAQLAVLLTFKRRYDEAIAERR